MTPADTDIVVAGVVGDLQHLRELAARSHVPEFLALDVTMQQAKAIHLVQAAPGIRMSALAAQLGVSLSTMSGNVERLSEMGLVARHEDPADRRQVAVNLTKQGETVLERFQDLGARMMGDLLSTLDAAELLGLQRGLRGLIRALEQHQAAALPGADPCSPPTDP